MERLQSRGVGDKGIFPQCNRYSESIMHALVSCYAPWDVWDHCTFQELKMGFRGESITSLLMYAFFLATKR